MNITVKNASSGATYTIPVEDATTTIMQIKELVEKETSIPPNEQRLIYRAKILKDTATVESCDIPDKGLLLLSRKAASKSSPAAPSSSTATTTPSEVKPAESTIPSTTPVSSQASTTAPTQSLTKPLSEAPQPISKATQSNPFAALSGLGGLGGLGDLPPPQEMESLMNNPAMQAMSDHLLEQMTNDPALFDALVASNPQLSSLLETNPDLRRMLQDPELIRKSMEAARNPALMREMMAQNDRAMANIESMPGGYNALASLYNDVQNPLMEAFEDALDTETPSYKAPSTTEKPANEDDENTDVLDSTFKPLSSSSTATTSSTNATTSASTNTTTNPYQQMLGAMQNLHMSNPNSNQGTATGSAPSNPFATSFGMPSMSQQQTRQDMEYMQSAMNDPRIQAMMDNMLSNPELFRTMMALNPQTQHLLNDPMFNAMIANPDFLRSTMQLLRPQSQPPSTTSPSSQQPSQQPPQAQQMNPFAAMMSAMNANNLNNPNNNTSPQQPQPMRISQRDADLSGLSQNARQNAAVMYASQIQSIMEMGFTDSDKVLDALIYTGGNVEAAINRLFDS